MPSLSRRLRGALLAAASAALMHSHAALPPFPQAVSFPTMPAASQAAEGYALREFALRDRSVRHRGRVWTTQFDYAATLGPDRRQALQGIVEGMAARGWLVLLREDAGAVPRATLKSTRDGKEVWASIEVKDQASVTWLEPGLPGQQVVVGSPAGEAAALDPRGDFAFLPAYPGSTRVTSARDDATRTWVNEYSMPEGATALEVATAYLDALKVAGWEVVGDTTDTGAEPVVTARFMRDGLELWSRVDVRRDRYSIEVGTAPLG